MTVTQMPASSRRTVDEPVDASAASLLLGESVPILCVRRRIQTLARAERALAPAPAPPVLITGETGTGKELVAQALHAGGPRAARPFVAINCAAVPANLMESEFFGHERGAFTDARQAKPGLFETAAGGTLFLDEVGELEPAMQAKLLRAIETRSIRRVGALQDVPIDVRILAATNVTLGQRVRDGLFRADLFYRLRVATIELPSLAARGAEDILLLARHFSLREGARYGRPGLALSAQARRALVEHDWPGNVRELHHVIERAIMMAAGAAIEASDLDLEPMGAAPVASSNPWQLPPQGVVLNDLEASLISQAMTRCNGNVTRAAAMLGLSRDTLRYRLERRREAACGGENP